MQRDADFEDRSISYVDRALEFATVKGKKPSRWVFVARLGPGLGPGKAYGL